MKVDKLTFSSSVLGITTSTCASCSSIGFFIIPTFEVFGLVVTDFFINYHVQLMFSIIFNNYNSLGIDCGIQQNYKSM